jgi:2-polyprenyl-6-methoxyphenol hydroxylase-like FAD-dependent oxidoreductase
MDYDVVIAGAGPVGLLLACELRLAGVSVLVLEKLADPNLPIKAGVIGGRTLNIPSVEAFYRRGLLSKVKDASFRWNEQPATSDDPNSVPAAPRPPTALYRYRVWNTCSASAPPSCRSRSGLGRP